MKFGKPNLRFDSLQEVIPIATREDVQKPDKDFSGLKSLNVLSATVLHFFGFIGGRKIKKGKKLKKIKNIKIMGYMT